MNTLKVLSMGAAIIALFYDCDAESCSKKQFGKDLVKEVKRFIGKFPSAWPGERRWVTICPDKKHVLRRNLTDKQRFVLGTRSLYRYIELLKDMYIKEAVFYGECSSTNKTKESLDMIKERLKVVSHVNTNFSSNDPSITLKPATVKRLSALHVLKEIQRFGKCVRVTPEEGNCSCVEPVFSQRCSCGRKTRKRSG